MARSTLQITEGSPYPLGATWDKRGINFAIFSANATKVELCIFEKSGRRELQRLALPEYTNQIWHGYVPGLRPGTVYGYRVYGLYEPDAGHRFNPNKLVLDPYARGHVGTLTWHPSLFGYRMESTDDLTFDKRDNARYMPKCLVVDSRAESPHRSGHRVPWEETIIYEMHVRGYTKQHPAVSWDLRGTYAGLGTREVLQYIKALGVTSIELLPVHASLSESHLVEKKLTNYWGYNTIGFFAPERRYAADRPNALREFKKMVAEAHEIGLEVILDVVYNHTAEGNELGPTLSFRGIDNASYYRLAPERSRSYINDAGTGNTLNFGHPRVVQMTMDSLRYWVQHTHVDGFRFDLATILARNPDDFDSRSGFLTACGQDPVLSKVKLIAEPWDCGPGGYRVGGFPPGWAEWNDAYRDSVRDFWRSEAPVSVLAERLSASKPTFGYEGRRPWTSVNFVTAHDGFTLRDLVSYNEKHNEANGENNADGSSHNRSWNCGEEGPTNIASIKQLRDRQMRNFLATLLLSQGTPMLLAGDEFGRTQHGNNNAYCQDNEISWLDWDAAHSGEALTRFVQKLTTLRSKFPVLRGSQFLNGKPRGETDFRDVVWLNADGSEMQNGDWGDGSRRCLGMLLDSRAPLTGHRAEGPEGVFLILVNAHHDPTGFVMPNCKGVTSWSTCLDTNDPEGLSRRVDSTEIHQLAARSLVLFGGELVS